MGTESHTHDGAAATYADVFESLFGAIARHRDAAHADEMAAALLRTESATRDLVGLTDDAQRAVYWSLPADAIVATRFDRHGVAGRYETLHQPISDATDWLSVHGDRLAWVHLRYR